MRTALRLDVSSDQVDLFDGMEDTYRREGLTVGSDYMRIYGVDFNMEVTLSNLVIGRRIGQGACSTVNIAKHIVTGELFAVKMFNIYDENQSRQLQIEICMLSAVKCDSLISLKGAFHSEGSIGVIIEYMDRGSLEFMLEDHLEVNERVMAAIAYQILWGLGYLHFDNRMHRDIKPGNILINSKGEVKLSDFGISRSLDGSNAMSSTSVGSFRYMSPERLIGDKYDSSGDIWSLGIMMVQLWTKKYPFEAISSPIDLLTELEAMEVQSFTKGLPESMAGIVQLMLAADPAKRGTCLELLEHHWFHCNSINDISDAQQTVEAWINGQGMRGGAFKERGRLSPKIDFSSGSKISSCIRNFQQNKGISPIRNCYKDGESSDKENRHLCKKNLGELMSDAAKKKHLSMRSNYSNNSDYSDDFEDVKKKHLSVRSNYSDYSDDFEDVKKKHLSIGSNHSNHSNYSDDFEDYVENDGDPRQKAFTAKLHLRHK